MVGWQGRNWLTKAWCSAPERSLPCALHVPNDEMDHDRLVALLAAAYRGRIDAATPARIAKVLTLWRGGDKVRTAIHLALARLPPIDPDDA